MKYISKLVWDILACPYCGDSLIRIGTGAKCNNCHEEYGYTNKGQLDLRLRRRKVYPLQFDISNLPLPQKSGSFKTLQKNTSPQVDFNGIKVPHHLFKELMSHFPKATGRNSMILDIGCGDEIHREVCEHAGFQYVGLDISSPDALILGDAHALPIKDKSFEFILSIDVLHMIQYPFVMAKEVYRIIKPGGIIIGTVPFLEPFHDTYYHFTHWGVLNLLQFAGFKVKYVSPSEDWTMLTANAYISLFPKLPHHISKALVMPLNLLHRLWWKIGYALTHHYKASEEYRKLSMSGAFAFIASRKNDLSTQVMRENE